MGYLIDLLKSLKKIAFKWPVRSVLRQGRGKVYPLLRINQHSPAKKLIEWREKVGYTIVDTDALWITLQVTHKAWTTLRVAHSLHNTTTIFKIEERERRFDPTGGQK